MRPSVLVAIASLFLSGCTAQAISQEAPAPEPEVITGDITPSQRRLVMRLTLTSPDDLQVQEGQTVQAGQVLADRVRERDRLQSRLEKVLLQIQQVSSPVMTPPPVRPIPEIAGLPPASFLAEVAEVERRTVLIESKQREVTQQQRLLDMLQAQGGVPEAVMAHEAEVMAQLGREVAQLEADHQLAIAQLQQAQAERQYLEYQHSVTVANRQLQIQQAELQRSEQGQRVVEAERDRQFKLSQLDVQRSQLEAELLLLSAVRAPFDGVVQRLKWEGQNDQRLIVELTLLSVVSDGSSPSVEPGGGAGTTSGGGAGTSP